LPRFFERDKAEIAFANYTADQRRLEFHHRMPGHRHNIARAPVCRSEQHDGTRFEQAIDFCQRQCALTDNASHCVSAAAAERRRHLLSCAAASGHVSNQSWPRGGIGCLGGGNARLQRHAADRTKAGHIAHNLGVHGGKRIAVPPTLQPPQTAAAVVRVSSRRSCACLTAIDFVYGNA
jgi:hypothetical protein